MKTKKGVCQMSQLPIHKDCEEMKPFVSEDVFNECIRQKNAKKVDYENAINNISLPATNDKNLKYLLYAAVAYFILKK